MPTGSIWTCCTHTFMPQDCVNHNKEVALHIWMQLLLDLHIHIKKQNIKYLTVKGHIIYVSGVIHLHLPHQPIIS